MIEKAVNAKERENLQESLSPWSRNMTKWHLAHIRQMLWDGAYLLENLAFPTAVLYIKFRRIFLAVFFSDPQNTGLDGFASNWIHKYLDKTLYTLLLHIASTDM